MLRCNAAGVLLRPGFVRFAKLWAEPSGHELTPGEALALLDLVPRIALKKTVMPLEATEDVLRRVGIQDPVADGLKKGLLGWQLP